MIYKLLKQIFSFKSIIKGGNVMGMYEAFKNYLDEKKFLMIFLKKREL